MQKFFLTAILMHTLYTFYFPIYKVLESCRLIFNKGKGRIFVGRLPEFSIRGFKVLAPSYDVIHFLPNLAFDIA